MTGPSNPEEPPARPTQWDPGRGPAAAAPPTELDPGRGAPQGTANGVAPPTSVDPGRAARSPAAPAAPFTAMDPGRVPRPGRPDGASGPVPSRDGLPPTLAARFEPLRELGRGAQAAVFVVRERATDRTLVLKVYDPTWTPNERVWAYLLSGRTSAAVVETVEANRVDGYCYELMEYLPGDDLMTLRRKVSLEELGPDGVKAVVAQLFAALEDLHANGIVHRDLKPVNVVVRTLDPIEIAVVDFGISSAAGEEVLDRNGTPPYTSPQFLAAGTVEPSDDFWALGITLIEFFTGTWIFDDLADLVALKTRIVSGQISAVAVPDERQRMLCTGLTAQAARPRWGGRQVRLWLDDKNPPVPGYQASTAAQRPGGAAEPYIYRGEAYRFPDELAAAMTVTWEDAALTLFGDDPAEKQLRGWLRQFPDVRWPDGRRRSREPINVRLLRVLRAMDATHPPIHRNRNIAVGRLPELAREAYEGEGNAPAVVSELATFDLLPLLARGRQTPELQGGDELGTIAAAWENERDRLASARTGLPEDARAYLARVERESPVQLLAVGLMAVTASADVRAQAERGVRRTARRARAAGDELGWFVELADRVDALWTAYLLRPFVDTRAEAVVADAAAARRRREWLRRTQLIREWSRRQNRPHALAWSVAGVATVGALWALLIGLSDVIGISSDATIVAAWLVLVLGLVVVLAAESLLAWEIGGRFHPRYSLLGAGRVEMGRAARSVLRRRAVLPIVLGVLAGLVAAAAFVPVLLCLVPVALAPLWAWRRFARWNDDRDREQTEIEQEERRRVRAREGVR